MPRTFRRLKGLELRSVRARTMVPRTNRSSSPFRLRLVRGIVVGTRAFRSFNSPTSLYNHQSGRTTTSQVYPTTSRAHPTTS